MKKKKSFGLTAYLGFSIFAVILIASIQSSEWAVFGGLYSSLALGLIGSTVFLIPHFAFHHLNPSECLQRKAKIVRITQLFIIQMIFFLFSLLFFYTLENQTQIARRLPFLNYGEILNIIRTHYWSLGFFPWLLYSILGMGLGFFSYTLHRPPTLQQALLPEHRRHPKLFLYNFYQIVNNMVLQTAAFLICALGVIWMSEAINISFGMPSWFEFPLRTLIIFGVVVLIYHKQNIKFITLMCDNKKSLAHILIGYLLVFSLLLGGVELAEGYFKLDETIFNNKNMESTLSLLFRSESKTIRLVLLIWGWWSLFIPIMSSLMARLSSGFKVIEWGLISLILPALIFLVMLPNMPTENLSIFSQPLGIWGHWAVVLSFVGLIWVIWRRTYNMGDILRGAMLPHVDIRPRPFKKWVRMCLMCSTSFLLGFYTGGWLQTQVVLSLVAFFIFLMVAGFIVGLLINTIRFLGEEKYKVPTPL